MKKKPTNIPASILAKLKNIADKDNFDFNFLLVRYIQERFLSRLAVSGHVNKFVLRADKGHRLRCMLRRISGLVLRQTSTDCNEGLAAINAKQCKAKQFY